MTIIKTVRIGTIPDYEDSRPPISIFARIEYGADKLNPSHAVDGFACLSITGVEGPMHNGDARGSCGQISMSYRTAEERAQITPAPGWTPEMIARFFDVWERWHMNDMQAGSPRQRAWIEAHPEQSREYTALTQALADAGLNPDAEYLYAGVNSRPAEPHPYRYGEAWIRESVPADVVAFLESLPDADKAPAWV